MNPSLNCPLLDFSIALPEIFEAEIMSSLPEEIYLGILLRVPVRCTFVCKCVCKTLFKLISDPDFDKMHLNRTTQTNKYSVMMKSDDGYSLYLCYDSLSSSSSDALVELETPYKYLNCYATKLLGSCNGLVYGRNCELKFFFLWNPATKEYKKLPRSKVHGYHGFGCDHMTGDYKLVSFRVDTKSTLVQVYSLKSNSWKSFQTTPRYGFLSHQETGVLCNGALHWFGGMIGSASSRMIVSMDISEVRFDLLQLPSILPNQYYVNMGVLEECLCVLVRNEETFDVWAMQGYGVSDTWTKLYTITYKSIMYLMGSFKNGEILFWDTNNVISYDPKYATAKKTGFGYHSGGAVKYFESLVSLSSLTATTGRRKKRENSGNLKESITNKRNR